MSWSFNMGMKKSLLGFDAWAREASAIALAANVTISFACCAAAFTGPTTASASNFSSTTYSSAEGRLA
jgi:hypothetical protein